MIVLGFRGLKLAVSCTSADVLAWLEEFLGFERVAGEADTSVALELDPRRHAALLSGAGPTGREVTCFTRDRGHKRAVELRDADGGALYLLEPSGMLIAPRPGGVTLVARDDLERAGRALMRTVREIAGAHARALGDVPLHGAAVVAEGEATAFVGPKTAGKTTLLCRTLEHPGAAYLANDRILVEIGVRVVAHGMPSIVTLRPGTLPVEARALDPPRFRELLGVPAVAAAPLRRVILLDREGPTELTRLAPEDAGDRLARHLLAGGEQAELFARGAPPLALGELAARVPCYALSIGYDRSRLTTRSLIGL